MPNQEKKSRTRFRRELSGQARLKWAGLLDIAADALGNFSRNENSNHAAAIGFYGLVALIPLLILTLIVLGYFLGYVTGIQELLLAGVQELHPYLSERFLQQLGQIEEKRRLLGGVGLIGLIWVSSMVFQSLERALNCIFRGEARRNFAVSLGLALGMMLLLWSVALIFVYVNVSHVFLPRQAADLALPVTLGLEYFWQYVLPQLLVVAAVTLIYRVVPQNPVSFPAAVAGAIFFAICMNAAKWAFSGYLDGYARYGLIYGSFDALIILVLWVYYLSLILLFGAELLSSYRRRDLILLERVILGKKGESLHRMERVYQKFGQTYPEGSYVFHEGDKGKELYFILQGGVALEKQSREITRTLACLGKGDYFGEMALLTDTRRTAAARVLEPSLIAVIPPGTFRAILRASGDVSFLMLKEFSRRLKKTGEMLDALNQRWMRLFLVAQMLLREETLPWDKRALAREVSRISGKEAEEIVSLLVRLQEEGFLSGDEAKILAIDRGRLRELVLASGEEG
jgi:membrane protein